MSENIEKKYQDAFVLKTSKEYLFYLLPLIEDLKKTVPEVLNQNDVIMAVRAQAWNKALNSIVESIEADSAIHFKK